MIASTGINDPRGTLLPETTATASVVALADTHQQERCPAAIPAPAFSLPSAIGHRPSAPILPVADVRSYLKTRKPVAHFKDEEPLFITLPDQVRSEIESLLTAFDVVKSFVKAGGRPQGLSVAKACSKAHATFANSPFIHLPCLRTFRNNFDLWNKTADWVSLVNLSKAGAAWQDRDIGLPDEFVQFCSSRIGSYIRDDARREAIRSVKQQWRTGKNRQGNPAPIPGYGFAQDWFQSTGYRLLGLPRRPLPERVPEPPGWHYSNIMRQIKARNTLSKAAHKLLLQGTAEARHFLPRVHGTRAHLRFMEQVQFDDVRCDFVIFDPRTGETMDLWLLIAHDVATGVLLGFGMRPARHREDGSQEHLKLRDVKQLLGWLLERFGLPPYLMHWKFEHGTATLSLGSQLAIQELLPNSIRCHFSSMIGGKSPRGYAERAVGNSTGKASLESHNRLMHIIGGDLAGQVGPLYTKRPTDILARQKECEVIWRMTQHLPETLRGQVGYSLLSLDQARRELFRIFGIRNHRTDHTMEGFETILEWYDPATGKLRPQNTAPHPLPPGAYISKRKEMPVERAERLVRAACAEGQTWQPVSPAIITAFFEHTQRQVTVQPNGLITFTIDGRPIEFAPPGAPASLPASAIVPGTKLLAYSHPDDPAYLHLTDGAGRILGTWLRRGLVDSEDSLKAAIRYTQTALRAAREQAAKLAAPEVAELEQMRARNAELLAANSFIDTTTVLEAQSTPESPRPITSPVASGLGATATERRRLRQEQHAAATAAANALLAKSSPSSDPSDRAAANDLLNALTGAEPQ
jgi:hypothetical protein